MGIYNSTDLFVSLFTMEEKPAYKEVVERFEDYTRILPVEQGRIFVEIKPSFCGFLCSYVYGFGESRGKNRGKVITLVSQIGL